MNAKRAHKQAIGQKTSSREAVENAISISKGPRSTTWDDLSKKDWNKSWEGQKEGQGTPKRKAA